MTRPLTELAAIAPPLAFVGAAGYLAHGGIPSWGWFFGAAILFSLMAYIVMMPPKP